MSTTILGIDPGSRITGFGVIQVQGNYNRFISCGSIHLKEETLSSRLHKIYVELKKVIQEYNPHEVAIEAIFMHQNPNSALKLGQARGAAIVAVASQGLSIHEYSARQVKQGVVGYGAAKKEQVQHMVKTLLNLSQIPPEDAADGLAIALTHAHIRSTKKFLESVAT